VDIVARQIPDDYKVRLIDIADDLARRKFENVGTVGNEVAYLARFRALYQSMANTVDLDTEYMKDEGESAKALGQQRG
jgi:hypothetical protein